MLCECCVIDLVATLHLTFACHAQQGNKITSLDGVVFPAGLTKLWLVSFHVAQYACGCIFLNIHLQCHVVYSPIILLLGPAS